ncbi:MAG: conjugal transfer protein TraG N-terminal domain-containing protein [Alphaproteobacteria bacterium]|jgi:conjugal transfer mating pair stabilization protein TraG
MNAVYTYGGGTLLWNMFNGIALVFNDPLFNKTLIILTTMCGLIWAYNRAMISQVHSSLLKWSLPVLVVSNLLFLPKTTVHIIDTVDPSRKYSTVDNVPIGLVMIFSATTTVSHELTRLLETKMFPASPSTFTKTGDFFSAKLIASIKDLHISSPTDRSNLKQFVNRCFTWPYVYANVGGLRDEALKTNNVMAFIKENIHHWNGSYWANADGNNFYPCQEGLIQAQQILAKESTFSLPVLADRIFGFGKTSEIENEAMSLKLKRLSESFWDRLVKTTDKAASLMDQMIMINTYKEARDDDRESSDLARLFPELVSIKAAHAHTTSQMGSMIKGALAEYDIPVLYGSVMAISLLLFIFVVLKFPLPGGPQTFSMWMKIILWVMLWPPFFVMFEALAAIKFEEAALSEMAVSQGLSIATYAGLTGLAFDQYVFFKGSLGSIPIITGFLVFGSPYALSQYTGKLTASSEASADRMGADAVDGNLSFDNQSFSNRTMGSMSMSQQTLGPSLTYASRMDTGGMSFVSDPTTGSIHADHHVSQMASNITSSDNFAASLNREISDVTSANEEKRVGYESSKSRHDQSTMSLVDSVSQGRVAVSGFSESENRDFQKLLEQGKQTSQSHGTDSLLESRVGANNTASAHLGVNAGGIIAKAVGIDAGANISAGVDSSASTSAIDKIAKENNWSAADKNLFTRGVQNIRTGNVETRDDASVSLANEQRENYEKLQQATSSYSAGLSHSKNLQTAKSLQDRGEISVVTAHNDDLMKEIADQNFGGNQMAAHQWANKNNDAWVRLGTESLKQKSGTLFKALESNTDLSEAQVKNLFNDASAKVSHDSANIETRNQEAGNLTGKYSDAMSHGSKRIGSSEARLMDTYNERGGDLHKVEEGVSQKINQTSGEIFEHGANERSKGVVKRSWENTIGFGGADDVRSGNGSTIESQTLDHYQPEMTKAPSVATPHQEPTSYKMTGYEESAREGGHASESSGRPRAASTVTQTEKVTSPSFASPLHSPEKPHSPSQRVENDHARKESSSGQSAPLTSLMKDTSPQRPEERVSYPQKPSPSKMSEADLESQKSQASLRKEYDPEGRTPSSFKKTGSEG